MLMKKVGKENMPRETLQLWNLTTSRDSYGISISSGAFQCNAGLWDKIDQEQTADRHECKIVSPLSCDLSQMGTSCNRISWAESAFHSFQQETAHSSGAERMTLYSVQRPWVHVSRGN